MTPVSNIAEKLLDHIEAMEVRSLTWGFVDGSISIGDAIAIAAQRGATNPEDVVEELVAARLLFEADTPAGNTRIRSRFGETVRLLVRSRQLFDGRPWDSAPRLVSDFRVDWRRRSYPRRDRPAGTVFAENASLLGLSAIRKDLWNALSLHPPIHLAGFQERSLVRLLASEGNTATIVTAGTGSGKTLAFYLPALIRVGEQVRVDQHWVKALAVYPRRELLKDQLAEAFKRARVLDASLAQHGRRPIALGALFSSTPRTADAQALKQAQWPSMGKHFVCPWLSCPRCDGALLWQESDIAMAKERLVCSNAKCGGSIDDSQLVLTRNRLTTRPPDILFTTTEILNQRLSDLRMRSLFGVGQPSHRKPLFALLDEVHTYVGTSGAQAALVLRRWRHLVDTPVTWCGLSATLAEAPRFFSELTGAATDQVLEVAPVHDEMTQEGAEYQVIVRGDPTLQASLLSTSIQAVMLVSRMLDPVGGGPSQGYFGQRVFVFTDDLDVTNRLFDNLRDAEAYSIFGRPDATRRPLAALRGREPRDPRREADGQRWWAPELIGRQLVRRLVVGRTTSQDAGVLANADAIVATATLEVGYNDDQVGAVIQHKAPRNAASFLQRRGRAGRVRGMRPLTLTVLSEYGRDRIAFQAYEHLFDPALPTQHLPIKNSYVLKMQAVFALIDWIAKSCGNAASTGWMWDLLSKPREGAASTLQRAIEARVSSLTKGEPQIIESLRQHLMAALHLEPNAAEALLWEPPRALLLEVVPTLARRLFRRWKLAHPSDGRTLDFHVEYHPLPDFVPRNLFSDLSLPEVQILLPPATRNDEAREDALPIVQALQQLAPGRVTRRFAFERGGLCHWVPVDPSIAVQTIRIEQYAERAELVGIFEGRSDGREPLSLPVYRPWTVRLSQVPRSVALPSSNAFPVWYSGFEPLGPPLEVDVPSRTAWSEVVADIRFYLHRFRSSVAVRRFAPTVRATVRQLTGESMVTVEYQDANGSQAALGFELEVDGLCLDFVLPSKRQLAAAALPPHLRASSRSAYHRYRLLTDESVPEEVNTLQREWLHQVWMTSTLCRAIRDQSTLEEASTAVLRDAQAGTFADVMRSLFALQELEAQMEEETDEALDDEDDQPRGAHARLSRLEQRLLQHMQRPELLECFRALATELDKPDPDRYGEWLHRTIHETVAEAVLQACVNTAPRHAALDTLVVDPEHDGNGPARVWVTETTLGGAGVLQAFADAFSQEPRALFRALEAALAPTDLELANEGLTQFVRLACEDVQIAALTARIRASDDHSAREAARKELYDALARRGLDVGHALSVSLNARLLRSGASALLDQLLSDLLAAWDELEARFALAVGVREFCAVALVLPGIRERVVQVAAAAGRAPTSDAELVQVLGAVLWPRSLEIRQRALQSYNPFRQRRVTDSALVRALLLESRAIEISIERKDWRSALEEALRSQGVAQLVASDALAVRLRKAVVDVLGGPVDVGFLQFFPVLERIERGRGSMRATVTLREHV